MHPPVPFHDIAEAIEKMDAMLESIDAFCAAGPGGDRVKEHIISIWKAFVADGESAEPLSAVFAKASGRAPELRTIQRCNMHALQANLEKAMKSDERMKKLLEHGVRQVMFI